MRLRVLFEGIPPYSPTGQTGDQYNDRKALKHLKEGKPMCLLTKYYLTNELRNEIADGNLGIVNVSGESIIIYRPEFEGLALRMAGYIRLMRSKTPYPSEYHVILGLSFGYTPQDVDKFLQEMGLEEERDIAWEKARDFMGSWFDKLVSI